MTNLAAITRDSAVGLFPSQETLDALRVEFAARADQYDRSGAFPHENFRRLHEHGLLAFAAPRAYGGGEASLETLARVVGTIARGDASTALVLTMQYLFHSLGARNPAWRETQRALVFRSAVERGALVNGLRVEPELGTPARGGLPATIARRTPDGWRISGRKIYSTGAPGLSWMLIWARSDEPKPRVGGWLVPGDAPGVSIVESWDHLGMRATGSHDVTLDDVLVPLEHGPEYQDDVAENVRLDTQFAAWNTILIAIIYDAVAREARDWFVRWLQERTPTNLGAPLATLPRFQEAVGRIDGLLLANRTLLDAAIAGAVSPQQVGLLKYLTSGNSIAAVEIAVELSGNPGLSRSSPLGRLYRDVLCSRVHTPQNDTILAGAGKSALVGV